MTPAVESNSAEETVAMGECLGRLVLPGDFVGLTGDLGSGKTHFVQGFAIGVGVAPDVCVTSPSYTLLNEYQGRMPLYHFDLYRLGGDGDIRQLGFDEYFFGNGVCIVEWVDRIHAELPDEYMQLTFSHAGEMCRRIDLSGKGLRYDALIREFFALWGKESCPR